MRWSIEIFFREIKSYLKIERFIGKNLNAVLIQIFSTLIAYVLMALFKTFYKISILEIKRRLIVNLLTFYHFKELLCPREQKSLSVYQKMDWESKIFNKRRDDIPFIG
jgi:hypothetical protein